MADLRERLVGQAFAPDDDALLVHVDTAVAVFADWLRDEAAGWHSRGNYEIQMRRERAGMRLRTAGLAIDGLADSLADRARALTHPDTKEAS